MNKTVIIREINGNLHVYSGAMTEEFSIAPVKSSPIPKLRPSDQGILYKKFMEHFKNLKSPAMITLGDGTCWFFDEDVFKLDIEQFLLENVTITDCFNASTF